MEQSMYEDKGASLVAMARLVAAEDAKTFKIVVTQSSRDAGTLVDLLIRSMGTTKKNITQLGYVASDEQNALLLRKRNPIVIVPVDILTHRPCVFYPPPGTSQVAIIQGTVDPAQVRHQPCSDESFTLK
jgi:hypothetical protein